MSGVRVQASVAIVVGYKQRVEVVVFVGELLHTLSSGVDVFTGTDSDHSASVILVTNHDAEPVRTILVDRDFPESLTDIETYF